MALPEDDLYPQEYVRGPRFTPYENLEGAKAFWLILRRDSHQSALEEDRRQLPGLNREQREIIEEAMRQHQAALDEIKREADVLLGNDQRARKALVKKNVEAWIRHLRSRAHDYRRYADEEKELGKDANNPQDRERHEANEKADRDEEDHLARMAGELAHDLAEAGL
jgi:hypothetical protein